MTIPRAYYRILREVKTEGHALLPDGAACGLAWEMQEQGLITIDRNTALLSITEAGQAAMDEYEARPTRRPIDIIVTAYDKRTRTTYGLRLVEEVDFDEDRAIAEAERFRKDGLCVIVRPKYNDDDKLSYHEFRSFDGHPFERVDFKVESHGYEAKRSQYEPSSNI